MTGPITKLIQHMSLRSLKVHSSPPIPAGDIGFAAIARLQLVFKSLDRAVEFRKLYRRSPELCAGLDRSITPVKRLIAHLAYDIFYAIVLSYSVSDYLTYTGSASVPGGCPSSKE